MGKENPFIKITAKTHGSIFNDVVSHDSCYLCGDDNYQSLVNTQKSDPDCTPIYICENCIIYLREANDESRNDCLLYPGDERRQVLRSDCVDCIHLGCENHPQKS